MVEGSISPLVLSHFDRAQIASVAILQLLRHQVTGEQGRLSARNVVDWPELRLSSASDRSGQLLTTLPPPFYSHTHLTDASRLLDYRCHAPGSALGTSFSPSMATCLSRLADVPWATWPIEERVGIGGVLGATSNALWQQLAQHAAQLLSRGVEAALIGAIGGQLLPSPCCSLAPCTVRPGARPISPPSPPSAWHPKSFGLLQDLSKSCDGSRGGGDGGTDGCGGVAAAARSSTRPTGAFVAKAAAARLADGAGFLPSAFDARFANPCWKCNASLCCLPGAHILGVSKCGTTDLYARLSAHPLVLPSLNKGPHFWDDSTHSLRWYVGLYAPGAARLEAGEVPSSSIFIDASSNTLTYAGVGVRGVARPEPAVVLPQVLSWLQPATRLIVMLREPAARCVAAGPSAAPSASVPPRL